MTHYELTLRAGDFADALRTATTGLKRGRPDILRLDHADGALTITGPGAAATLDAVGDWPRGVRVNAGAIANLAKGWPGGESPLLLRIEGARLHFGNLSLDVEVVETDDAPVTVAINATDADLLRAVAAHGRSRVLASVAGERVEAAEAAFARRVDEAWNALKDYGVARADMEALATSALNRTKQAEG